MSKYIPIEEWWAKETPEFRRDVKAFYDIDLDWIKSYLAQKYWLKAHPDWNVQIRIFPIRTGGAYAQFLFLLEDEHKRVLIAEKFKRKMK